MKILNQYVDTQMTVTRSNAVTDSEQYTSFTWFVVEATVSCISAL